MGSKVTKALNEEELRNIAAETGFTTKQVARLYNRFINLDKAGRGVIDREDLSSIPEVAVNPIGDRICNQFIRDNGETIDFRTFAQKLACFTLPQKGRHREFNSADAKCKFIFGLYDYEGVGHITTKGLEAMLGKMIGPNIDCDQIAQMAQNAMDELDTDQDGIVSYKEFLEKIDVDQIDKKMSIKFLE